MIAVAAALVIGGTVSHAYTRKIDSQQQLGKQSNIPETFLVTSKDHKVSVKKSPLSKVDYFSKETSPLFNQWNKPYKWVPPTTQLQSLYPKDWTPEFAQHQTNLDQVRPLIRFPTLDERYPLGLRQPFISKAVLPLRQASLNIPEYPKLPRISTQQNSVYHG
jgi:hypothetical protein